MTRLPSLCAHCFRRRGPAERSGRRDCKRAEPHLIPRDRRLGPLRSGRPSSSRAFPLRVYPPFDMNGSGHYVEAPVRASIGEYIEPAADLPARPVRKRGVAAGGGPYPGCLHTVNSLIRDSAFSSELAPVGVCRGSFQMRIIPDVQMLLAWTPEEGNNTVPPPSKKRRDVSSRQSGSRYRLSLRT